MAVPTNAIVYRAWPLKTGVMLGVSPSSDPTFDVEIARATSSGVYETIDRLSPNTGGVYPSFTDILPGTTNTFSYKARAIKDGWNAGDYTNAVTVRPSQLPEYFPPITPLTGKGIGAPLFVASAAPPTVGRANSVQYVRKYLTLSFTEIQPDHTTSTERLFYDAVPPLAYAENAPNTASGWMSAALPPGVILRSLTLNGYVGTASTAPTSTSGDLTQANVYLSEFDYGTASTFAALQAWSTAVGVVTDSLTTLSNALSTDSFLTARITVRTVNPTFGNRGGFIGLRVGYDMPSYDKAV